MDVLTLGTGVFSFGIFLLIHLVSFRWLSPERLFNSLKIIIGAVMVLPVVLMVIMFFLNFIQASLGVWVCAGVLAVLVNGLLSFFYVLCVFGPYETSVRMRLVREIQKGAASGISRQELLKSYNAQTIVDLRLRRLMGSGDIIVKDGLYLCNRRGNVFFIFDTIAGIIKHWIGR